MMPSSSRTQEFARKTGATPQTATLARSYILGLSPEGQSNGQAIEYFLRDGHGSTRAVIDTQGSVIAGAAYDYEAFGDPIGFDPELARTIHLFGGDAEFDVGSRLYYHDARWRDGFLFISTDSWAGSSQDPLSLHKYLYASANPVMGSDPSGHMALIDNLGSEAIGQGMEGGEAGMANAVMQRAMGTALDAHQYQATVLRMANVFKQGQNFEKLALRIFDLAKNTGRIVQNGVRSIPDAYQWGKALWEFKNVQYLCRTPQLMAQIAHAVAEGIEYRLVVAVGTRISPDLWRAIQAAGGAIYELAEDGSYRQILRSTALGY